MKLGAMLIRDGRLTAAQVGAAVAQQARVGGRLGTVLVEMRLVDPDTLTVYLGLELGIPIATRAALERAKRAAVRLVSAELSEQYCCVPLVVQDRQLILAMRDPHDLLALDELAQQTGHRIIPRVAPEVRLYYYMERYYGIPRPDRFRALGDWVAAPVPRSADYIEPPPPPLPGLPPQARRPVAAPNIPIPIVRREESDEIVRVLEEDEPEITEAAPARAPTVPPPAPPRLPVPSTPVAATPEKLGFDEAFRRMQAAEARAEVADAMVAHARSLFDVGALLVVRDDLAYGWKGFGPDLDEDRIETLLIPLDSSSIFRAATDANEPWAGPAAPGALHAHLFRVLRTSAPRQAVVVPVAIRDRVVNLLYGHKNGDGLLAADEVDGLKKLAAAAANAYVRLIALQKATG